MWGVHDTFGKGIETQAYPSAPDAECGSVQSLAGYHNCTTHGKSHYYKV